MLQKFSAKRCATRALPLAGAVLLALAGGCQIGGCQNGNQDPGHPQVIVQGQNGTGNSPQPSADGSRIVKTVINTAPPRDTMDPFDPCALQMQDLVGPLLEYFGRYKHGPANIAELNQFAIPGVAVGTICPVSKKPYLCAPNGLRAPGENVRIYIYDAAPVHEGQRWCVMDNGATSGAPGFFTAHIPEARFQKFLAASAPAAAPEQNAPHPLPAPAGS